MGNCLWLEEEGSPRPGHSIRFQKREEGFLLGVCARHDRVGEANIAIHVDTWRQRSVNGPWLDETFTLYAEYAPLQFTVTINVSSVSNGVPSSSASEGIAAVAVPLFPAAEVLTAAYSSMLRNFGFQRCRGPRSAEKCPRSRDTLPVRCMRRYSNAEMCSFLIGSRSK